MASRERRLYVGEHQRPPDSDSRSRSERAEGTGKNHEHLFNRVILYLNDQANGKADEVRLGPPRVHVEENASGQPAAAIAVELK